MAKYKRKGEHLDWRNCYTGDPPLAAETGIPAQQMWNWLSQWRQHEHIACYSGRASATINGGADSNFYIIT